MTLTKIDLPWHYGDEASIQNAHDKQEFESAVDYVAFKMEHYSWTREYADYVKGNPRVSNLALALIATKMTEPVRIGVILAVLPRISRMLGVRDSNNSDKSTDVEGESKIEKNEKVSAGMDNSSSSSISSVKKNDDTTTTTKKE